MEMVITPEAFAQLRAENEQLKARYDALQFELSQLKRLLFGTRRERLVLPPPNQGSLDLDGDVPADSTPPEVATVTRTVTVPVRRHPHRDEIPAHLSRVVEVLDLSEAEKPCPCCGEARQVLGELISEKLDYVPATLQVLQTRRPQYVCHACAQIDVAPLPPAPIEQGLAAPGLLAQVATAKLIDHIPVERQCRILAREGVRLSPNTVLDWFPAMGQLLKPLFQALLQVIFTSDILHSDDTILPLKDTGPGRKPGKLRQARLWTWHSGLHPLVAYQFTRDRSGSHVRDWLQAWSGGYLVADAYSGYDALFAERPDIIEVGCWATCGGNSMRWRSPPRYRAWPRKPSSPSTNSSAGSGNGRSWALRSAWSDEDNTVAITSSPSNAGYAPITQRFCPKARWPMPVAMP